MQRGIDRIDDLLWVRRKSASSDRALEHGRRGIAPDPMDAAALVRQYRGEDGRRLAHEILSEPYAHMVEPVLRPLCAVNARAAAEVMELAEGEGETAELATRLWSGPTSSGPWT